MVRSINSQFEIISSNWLEKCKEYKKMAISDDMADQIQNEFEADLSIVRMQARITREETGNLEKGSRQLRRYVEIALTKGKVNHAKQAKEEIPPHRASLRDLMTALHKR